MSSEQGRLRPGLTLASVALGAAMLLQGCATPQNRDPLESFNRKVFGFNEALDGAVVKPAAKGYAAVVPEPVQTGIGNFINNIKDVWSAINLLLQGQGAGAAEEVLRVGINTTLGMAGFVDVATSMQLDRHNEDLGQTLGVWG
ncbi:MAG TPA: VacJ family lipoprotein, partial [Aquabacterium sp.]|nr:VacJ family lipoprotein [Aquabacterium sp.]